MTTITDLLALVNDLSTPVKIGWIVWLAWMVAQVVWFRYGRVERPAALLAPARPRVEARSAVMSKPAAPAAKPLASFTGGSPEFLAALGLEPAEPAADAAASGKVRSDTVYS